jgi:hypothetical protein
LDRAQQLKIEPNFYLSEPYLKLCKAKCWEQNNWIWIEADKWCLFPRLSLTEDKISNHPTKKVWSDFNGWPSVKHREFLDWEYVFNPVAFNDMSGGTWEIFRKNSRKWQKTNKNWVYCGYFDSPAAALLVAEWLEAKQQTVQDADLIIEYVLNLQTLPGIQRRCLYDEDERLMAINTWDENWQYINFRFCIIRQGEPFLDEFVRWLFYTDSQIQATGKLINDGGTVGNIGLEHFKDKLNPVRKRKVMSWIVK